MISGHLGPRQGEVLWRPLVYIYQLDKYQETYEASFRALLGRCTEKNIFVTLISQIFLEFMTSQGAGWMPGFRMNADWEKAERNAWRNVFGDVPLDGCLFHFGTHISKKCLIKTFLQNL